MPSKTEICNLALVRLGAPPIENITDLTKTAIVLNSNYDTIRDIVLRDHPWNFATRRVALARLDDAPAWGFSYAYQIPGDCLRILGIQNPDSDSSDDIDPTMVYKVEENKLLTDEETVALKYIYRCTTEGYFDTRFCSAFAARLAAEIAYYITGSPGIKQELMKEYMMEIVGARSIDAQENPADVVEDSRWSDARL